MLTDRPSRTYFGTFAILREPTPNNELMHRNYTVKIIVSKRNGLSTRIPKNQRGQKSENRRVLICVVLCFYPLRFRPPALYSRVFLHARLPTSVPFSWAKKIESGTRVRARETGRGAGPTKPYFALLVGLLLLFSSRLTCSHVPAPEPHRHRLRTTRALPPNTPKETSGNLSAAAPIVCETLSSFRCSACTSPTSEL